MMEGGGEGRSRVKGGGVWSEVVQAGKELENMEGGFFGQFIRVIGNGLSTSFWADKWVGEVKLNEHFPRLFQLENNKDILVGDRGNWIDDIWVWNWDWNRSPQRRVVWLDPKGEFSVKSLSQWIEQRRVRREAGITKTKWNTLVPRKVNVFIWRALNGRIHVRNELDKKGIDMDSIICPSCENVLEYVNHCLVLCEKVRYIWKRIFDWNMKVFKGKTENGTKLCKDIQVKAFEWISGRSKRWNL
ncbi:reverse transcriptase domain, reverse transcriptase zinc-binding domain protein [Tanacetum coccineum]